MYLISSCKILWRSLRSSVPEVLKPDYHSVEKHLSKKYKKYLEQSEAKCEDVMQSVTEPHSRGRGSRVAVSLW